MSSQQVPVDISILRTKSLSERRSKGEDCVIASRIFQPSEKNKKLYIYYGDEIRLAIHFIILTNFKHRSRPVTPLPPDANTKNIASFAVNDLAFPFHDAQEIGYKCHL